MTQLYLRYRAAPTDPWTGVPDLTSAFLGLPVGALPLASAIIASEPQIVTPGESGEQLWLPFESADDAYLALHATCSPLPLALEKTVMTFLINYKLAGYHEMKYAPATGAGFGQGGYITAALSLLEAKEQHGTLHLRFRLASALADALTNT